MREIFIVTTNCADLVYLINSGCHRLFIAFDNEMQLFVEAKRRRTSSMPGGWGAMSKEIAHMIVVDLCLIVQMSGRMVRWGELERLKGGVEASAPMANGFTVPLG